MSVLYHVIRIFARCLGGFFSFKQKISALRRKAGGILLASAVLLGGVAPVSAADAEGNGAAAYIAEGLLSCAETLELSAYAVPASALGQVYAEALYGHPELFHAALRLSFSAVGTGEARMVTEIYPVYLLTGDALTAARAFYRDTVSAVLSDMDTAFGGRSPSEVEIALYLHDHLADRYAYDTRESGQNADAYTFFRDGVGICQAYALAFMALAGAAGLEADFVSSAAMDHAWNHVRVDGVWYHVDVTRDDPIPAQEGGEEVNHTRLLRSDEGMAALGYHGYTCAGGHACTDTRFEPDGEAALAGFHDGLRPCGDGWLGEAEDGAPVAVEASEDGFSTGERGDTDGDGKITPADLLAVYDEEYPEAWRGWLRFELTGGM